VSSTTRWRQEGTTPGRVGDPVFGEVQNENGFLTATNETLSQEGSIKNTYSPRDNWGKYTDHSRQRRLNNTSGGVTGFQAPLSDARLVDRRFLGLPEIYTGGELNDPDGDPIRGPATLENCVPAPAPLLHQDLPHDPRLNGQFPLNEEMSAG